MFGEPERLRLKHTIYAGEREMEVLAEYFPEEGFLLPINVMIVDQECEAARVTITADGATTWH